jgi:apolipoprotein N-acyltransferase
VESITHLIDRLGALRGVRVFLVSTLLGALGVLGHAPFHIWPLFGVSIWGLFILVAGASLKPKPMRSGFFVAWSWAFGYFLAGMFWVGNAFLVDADKFAWLMPFAVTALPAGLAIFWGAGGAIAARLWRKDPSHILVFVIVFTVVELARGHLLTGLPWNLPAYIWAPGGVMSQTSALIGPYGLSTITLFLMASPVALMSKNSKTARAILGGVTAAMIVGTISFGAARLHLAGPVDPMQGIGPIISAGQGGFTQKEVWDPANAPRVTETYFELLSSPAVSGSDIIIWPEGAFPYLLLEQPDVLAELSDRLGPRRLVVGSVRRTQSPSGDIYANSILSFARAGDALKLEGTYDKYHLVPFGEYLPLRGLFSAVGIASLVSYDGEMTPGPGPSTFVVQGAPLADPRVCYEIVFPHFNPDAATKAGWILNVSIDAWYGDLLGPDQHYAQARARAIESGMPLVRAASGGWSAIVDRYGRPLAQFKSGTGYATARLPLDAQPTLYGLYGERLPIAILLILVACVLVSRKYSVAGER